MTELEQKILQANHTLIAGTSGSGKSVLINDLLCSLYASNERFALMCIDIKRVELFSYRYTKQCTAYADDVFDAIDLLDRVSTIIDARYQRMQEQRVRKSNDMPMYVVIDELADLMLTAGQAVKPLIQRITQLGRACNIKLIAATQCPLATVIPTSIKVNFDAVVGLRTRSAQDSRNIINQKGCEMLPMYGKCYLMIPEYRQPKIHDIPYLTDAEIEKILTNSQN